jgi:hypothetical protein
MGAQRTTFDKLQRERAKKAKAIAKRERRQDRTDEPGDTPGVVAFPEGDGLLSPAELLELVATIHAQFEAGDMSFEDYEERKTELLARLPID